MMLRHFLSFATVTVTSGVMLMGCGNSEPTVDAGPDADVGVGRTFKFGATASDPDGDVLTYAWVMTAKPTKSKASFIGASAGTAAAAFVPDVVGTYDFSVTVSDGDATSEPDTVTLTARIPPHVRVLAGIPPNSLKPHDPAKDITILPEQVIKLDAKNSTVTQGREKLMAFQWAVSPPRGVEYALKGGDTSTLTFTLDNATTASKVADARLGKYGLTITVGDSGRKKNGDLKDITTEQSITVYARNPPAVKIAAPDTATVGMPFKLDGSGSKVGVGGKITYAWSVAAAPAGAAPTFKNSKAAITTVTMKRAGRYVLQLEVGDGVFSATARKTVEAR